MCVCVCVYSLLLVSVCVCVYACGLASIVASMHHNNNNNNNMWPLVGRVCARTVVCVHLYIKYTLLWAINYYNILSILFVKKVLNWSVCSHQVYDIIIMYYLVSACIVYWDVCPVCYWLSSEVWNNTVDQIRLMLFWESPHFFATWQIPRSFECLEYLCAYA